MPDLDAKTEKELTGSERAAVVLVSLGDKHAAGVMRHLENKEVQKLGYAMAQVRGVTRKTLIAVLRQFLEAVEEQTPFGVGMDEYLKGVLSEALGPEKAKALMDRIMMGVNTRGIDDLKWMDPRLVADVIGTEHPQIIATILAHLESEQAGDILSLIPPQARAEVVMRIATLDSVQPNAISELSDILEKQFTGAEALIQAKVGGIKVAADIMNYVDSAIEHQLLGAMSELDPNLAQRIQEKMFVFEDLVKFDDKSIQALIREVEHDTLMKALKGADEALKEKFMKNITKRQQEVWREDLEYMGPIRLSEVEEAQRQIVAIARRLAESGGVTLGRGREEYV